MLSRARARASSSSPRRASTACRFPLERMFELGDPPDYEPPPGRQRRGTSRSAPASTAHELYVDLLLADDGRALLYLPFLNYFDGNLDAAAEMLAPPATPSPGSSDGGAHVGTICDASFPTSLLTHWGRDRTSGTTFDLPFLVHRQSRATAEAVGLLDRGLLAPGYKADVNVIDFDAPRARAAADGRTTCPPAASGSCRARPATCHTIVVGRRDLRRRRAHRRAARPPRARPARPTR